MLPFVEKEESRMQRLQICQDCTFYTKHNQAARCSKCGCIIPLKAFLKQAQCPVGKWNVTEADPETHISYKEITP